MGHTFISHCKCMWQSQRKSRRSRRTGRGCRWREGYKRRGLGRESEAAFTHEVASELLIPAPGLLTMGSLMLQSHLKSWITERGSKLRYTHSEPTAALRSSLITDIPLLPSFKNVHKCLMRFKKSFPLKVSNLGNREHPLPSPKGPSF